MVTIMKTSGDILFIVIMALFGPLVTIWVLNTLFPVLQTPVNIGTWLAVLWLSVFVFSGKK